MRGDLWGQGYVQDRSGRAGEKLIVVVTFWGREEMAKMFEQGQ